MQTKQLWTVSVNLRMRNKLIEVHNCKLFPKVRGARGPQLYNLFLAFAFKAVCPDVTHVVFFLPFSSLFLDKNLSNARIKRVLATLT
jgi:hypothetical protein